MTTFALYLLGPPRLEADGISVHIGRRKAMALLAYLAVTGRIYTREALASLLWPEWDPSGALAELRRQLSLLRRCLGDAGLEADGEMVELSPELDLWVDVGVFRAQLAACTACGHAPTVACPDCAPLLERAAALYTDGFMAGFTLEDSAAFDEWQFFEAEALKDEAASALVRLATYAASQGGFERAIAYARRWLAIDPLHEPAHRHLMVLYAKANRRAAALRQYEILCRTLKEELGAAPSPRTQEVYEGLLRGEIPLAPTATEAILERELRQVGPCPYRGLAAFREEDAPFFFGRETFVHRLTEAVTRQPFVALVVGASGSGKSSVVYAGLLPRLRSEGGWCICDLRPGQEPFYALADALLPHLAPALGEIEQLAETRQLAGLLKDGTVPLIDAVQRIRAQQVAPGRLLLLVDQFEELYTLCPDPGTRRRFIDTLLDGVTASEAAGRAPGPLTALVTLRADFMGQALSHRRLAGVLQDASQMLGPMGREELRAAIEEPAAVQGAAFEAGLVDRLLDDVGEEPGNLPLLEFALTLLWERLDFGWATHAAYEQIGRVAGALAQYAQEVYEALPERDQSLCRRIFTQLVQPGEGTEDTRRVATRHEVGDDAWNLVHQLADQRLVVTGRDTSSGAETVEVVHEALIGNWGELQAWMAEDRAFRTWQERLRVALRTWETTDHDEGALLRGVPLAEAKEWLAARADELSPAEGMFIEAGIALRERRAAEREAQHQAALRQAAIGLAAEARSRMQGPDQDLAILLALEAVEHYPYTWQAEHALADIVLDWRLVMQMPHGVPIPFAPQVIPNGSRLLTAANDGVFRVWDLIDGKKLLTVQAYEKTEASLLSAKWSPTGDRVLTYSVAGGQPKVWEAQGGRLLSASAASAGRQAEWSPDGTLIVNYRGLQSVSVWDARNGEHLHTLPGNEMTSARFSYDGRWIVTSLGQIWDTRTGKLARTLVGYQELIPPGDLPFVNWSPNGAYVGTGTAGEAWVWEAATGVKVLTLHTGYRGHADLWWSPDASRVLTTGWTGKGDPAILWDARSGERLRDFPYFDDLGVAPGPWSPEGKRLLLSDEQGVVTVWDAGSGRELLRVVASGTGRASPVWLPNGSGFITGGGDGLARIWRISSSLFDLSCQPDCPGDTWSAFNTAVWSPDGRRIARGFDDGSVRIWDVISRIEVTRIRRQADNPGIAVSYLAWSPDSRRLLTGGGDGGVEIWDSDNGELVLALAGHGNVASDGSWSLNHVVMGLAWSPDGRRALSCGRDRQAIIWDTVTGEALTVYTGQEFFWGAWSPDGTRVVLVDQFSYGGPVRIWDAETGEPLLTLLPDDFDYGTTAVAWSPDGTRIVTFSLDKVGRLWDTSTGKLQSTFAAEHFCHVAQWSPSGDRFLAGGQAGVRVWDASTLEQVARYPAAAQASNGSWSPDGTAIAIGYANGETKVYPAWQSLEELVAYAKAHCVLRELTPEERARYGLADG